jgi:tetratricopeptide (TPR) repeat protein
MRLSQFSLMVSSALTLNLASTVLPSTPNTRSLMAPAMAQTVGDRLAEADRLLSQGMQQMDTSQFQEAFQSWQQALAICRDEQVRAGDPLTSSRGEASALMSLGYLYSKLNDPEQAIKYYQQALPMFQTLSDRNSEANVLLNWGVALDGLKQYQQSIEHYDQALLIYREVSDRQGEASALQNLGAAYGTLKQFQKEIEYSEQALPISREVNNRRSEADILTNLGNAYGALREYQKAIDYYRQALPIFREVGNRNNEGLILANIGKLYINYDSPQSAIQFLQQSVEVRESIRAGITQLSPQIQQFYLDSFAADYRLLAELLKQQNRQAEAQQVLDLLK